MMRFSSGASFIHASRFILNVLDAALLPPGDASVPRGFPAAHDRLVGTASWRHIELKGLGGFAKRIQACLGNSFGAFAFIKQADRLEGDGPILMPFEGSGWRELRIAAPASPRRQLNKWRGANVVVHEPLEEAQTRTVSHHQEFR